MFMRSFYADIHCTNYCVQHVIGIFMFFISLFNYASYQEVATVIGKHAQAPSTSITTAIY
jgi:hypothetical protein